MRFTDAVSVARTRRTADGYLVADARTARTGIQVYTGAEVGKPDLDRVRVYRPAAEVFHRDALASFAHRPMTLGHPKDMVSAATWKDVSVGHTGEEVARDGDFVRVPMMIADAKAIAAIEAGDRQLSAGYVCELDWTSGRTQDGAYDAIQRNIRINHVAIVPRGRAGADVRIGDQDSTWGAAPLFTPDEGSPDMADNLRTVVVDGLSVSTTDQGAQAIEKLTKDRDEARQALADAKTAHATAIKAKDEEIGVLKADKKKLEDAAPKPADLDRMVADRVALVTAAKAIVADLKPDGLTDAEIRKAVVIARLGDEIVKDASDDMVAGMFRAIAKDAKAADPVRDALRNRDAGGAFNDADKARREAEERERNAWKGKAA